MSFTILEFSLIFVSTSLSVLSVTMELTILEVSLVSLPITTRELPMPMLCVVYPIPLVTISICPDIFSMTMFLIFFKCAVIVVFIRVDTLALPTHFSIFVITCILAIIRLDDTSETIWQVLKPLTLAQECISRFSDHITRRNRYAATAEFTCRTIYLSGKVISIFPLTCFGKFRLPFTNYFIITIL